MSTRVPPRAPPSSTAPANPPAPDTPRFAALPDGWSFSCSAFECATSLAYGAADPPGVHWRDITPSTPLDVASLGEDEPSCTCESPALETCVVRADFDGDGREDLLTPILAQTFQPGFAVAWGDGGPMSTLGPANHGSIAPVREPGTCATSLQDVLDVSGARTISDFETLEATTVVPGDPTPFHRSGLRLAERIWLGFDGDRWRVATPERRAVEHAAAWVEPWTPDVLPPQCQRARTIRKKRYRGHEVLQWHPPGQVARDPCSHKIDFDSDGVLEVVSWVVANEQPGLQITGLDRGTARFGAGRASAFEVLDGEPGCHGAPVSLDDVWDVAVAPWDGAAWGLGDGRSYAPSDPELIDGPALALTNAYGHVDLLFLSRGGWKVAAVPFEWERYFVFWPAMDQWNWVAKPLPWARRDRRPTPPHRDWVKKHTPGPRPTKAGRFYPGH